MRVEVVSPKKQRFNGKSYWKDQSSGYYRNAAMHPHSLHRQVYIFHKGEIPKGMVVDHINRDKDNNQIENLRAVTQSVNGKNVSSETTAKRKRNFDRIRPLTKKWHASEEGREWHKKHGVDAYKKRKPIKKICAHCGCEYYTTAYHGNARFCGQNCKMKARRRRLRGLPENCPHC